MSPLTILLLILAGIVLIAALYSYSLRRRRQHLLNQPFPLQWDSTLRRDFPLYSRLPRELRRNLQKLIREFITDKYFEACGGLEEVTDEMKVLIAAQACLLVVNNQEPAYPKLRTILIYPSAYKTNHSESLFHFTEEESGTRLGESWSSGSVVLAWDSVLHDAHDAKDGHNLVLHEFAHQLDQLDGAADGAPDLGQRSRYVSWARVLGEEFEDLEDRVFRHKKSVFDSYGATNPAEFFAVVTETFFEKPKQMNKKHPELYAEFKQFYQLDPLHWK